MQPFQAILVEGTSGAGKSTLIDAMIRRHVSSSPARKMKMPGVFWTVDLNEQEGAHQ